VKIAPVRGWFANRVIVRWTPLPMIRERDGRRASLLTWCHDREPRD
jgi:hypothetical protein